MQIERWKDILIKENLQNLTVPKIKFQNQVKYIVYKYPRSEHNSVVLQESCRTNVIYQYCNMNYLERDINAKLSAWARDFNS